MALSKEEEETLKSQGLKEDIRNQLSNAKNISSLFERWKNEKNLKMKKEIFKLLGKFIGQLGGNVDHICDSLDCYEAKKTGW